MRARREASMDGQALLSEYSQPYHRNRGRDVPQSGGQVVWDRNHHGHRLDAAARGDRQRWAWPDGWPQVEGNFWRSRGLAVAAAQLLDRLSKRSPGPR